MTCDEEEWKAVKRSESGVSREVASLPNTLSLETYTLTVKMGTVGGRYSGTMETTVAGGDTAEVQDNEGQIIVTKGDRGSGIIDR